MKMNEFRVKLPSSPQVVICFLGGRDVSVGGLLVRTHSEQRARASRGHILYALYTIQLVYVSI